MKSSLHAAYITELIYFTLKIYLNICRNVRGVLTFVIPCIYNRTNGLVGEVFTNGPGDRDLIPVQVIQKTREMVLDAALFNTEHCKIRVRGKWSNPGKGVTHCPISRCCCYWKGNLWVTLNYVHQHTFSYIYIYIYDKNNWKDG